ncbi:MDR family MFS transporter [Psychromarinibacter sp. C21-152]|uniref:MDR family MFS transporter n=1 Tax=Psychromarinibacter sediminicola TaxID=3033385 RepID=A0AAE3T702_9RHOB|nr:MDR family MFS transporter [Psychromarinibacter sediminicola]MDF0599812.1 MDR family MFS transporter [Psychromarinibacter sediminicola]
MDHTPPEGVDRARFRLVFLAIASVLFLASLGQTVVTTALPIIVGELGGLDQIAWVITAYLAAATVAAPVFGKLGDLYGRKRILQVGIGVFLLGSLISALSPNIWVLVAGRFVQGAGGGGLIVVSMATIADVVPPRQRGKYQGLMGAVFGVSTVVGPLAGGFIVQHLHWSWMFLANLPLGLLAFGIIAAVLDGLPPRRIPVLDYAGAVLLTVSLSLAVIIASTGGDLVPWTSPVMWALIAALVAAFGAFIAAERRAAEPILPLELFRVNNFVVSNTVGLITGVAMFGTITFLPMFMQVVKGLSPAMSGLFIFPMMLGMITASATAGQIMSRTGKYRMLPVWSTMLLAVAMGLMASLTTGTPNGLIAAYTAMAGIGIGPVMGVGVTAIQNAVPVGMVGVGTASANMFRLIGGSLGTAIFGAIFAYGLTRELGGVLGGANPRGLSAQTIAGMDPAVQARVAEGIAQALQPVFLIGAVMACLACLVALMMVELPLSDRMPEEARHPAE